MRAELEAVDTDMQVSGKVVSLGEQGYNTCGISVAMVIIVSCRLDRTNLRFFYAQSVH